MLLGKITIFLKYIFCLVWLVIAGYPFIFVFNTSLKERREFFTTSVWSSPESWQFQNYIEAVKAGFLRYFLNTGFVTFSAVILIVIIAAMASYVITRIEFKYSNLVFLIFVAGMMIPIHSTLIPVYRVTRTIGLYNTLTGLIGPYVAFGLPISVFILTGFMRDIPPQMEEAAIIDGASKFQIFTKIIFPLSRPAIFTVAIYNLVIFWNEFVYALILISSPGKWNITLGLWNFQGRYGTNIPMVMTGVIISAVPVIILYLFFQDQVIRGMTAGALKE